MTKYKRKKKKIGPRNMYEKIASREYQECLKSIVK